MASYKNRVKELEAALSGIETLTHSGDADLITRLSNILYLARHVREGGTVQSANVKVMKKSAFDGRPVSVALGTPLCCDPSSETYWSM